VLRLQDGTLLHAFSVRTAHYTMIHAQFFVSTFETYFCNYVST